MFKSERTQIAVEAVGRFVALTGASIASDSIYIELLRHKLELVLAVVDLAAHHAGDPLFIKDAVAGYDVVVYPPLGARSNEELDVPIEAATELDARHLDALKLILDKLFTGRGDSVLMHESGDGMHYLISQAARRDEVLVELGFDASEMVDASSLSAGVMLH